MPILLDFAKARAFWPAVIGVYFTAQAALRVGVGDVLGIDEAEAWLWAQNLDWGYGPQPPLYNWLQYAIFSLTGANAFGVALLKALLLWGIFLCGIGLARRWSGAFASPIWIAGAAALALFWLPELAWESQRTRTHNVLAGLVALASMWQFLRLMKAPSGRNHVLLGFLIGLGFLSKWNFGFLAAGFVLAALLSGGAQRLARPAALSVLLLPALMVAPTVLWISGHPSVALSSYGRLGIENGTGAGEVMIAWLSSISVAVLSLVALPVIMFGAFAFFGRARAKVGSELADDARAEMRLVALVVGLAFALVLVAGMASGITEFLPRWLMPLALPLLPAAGIWLMARIGPGARRAFVATTLGLLVVLLVGNGYMLCCDAPLRKYDFGAMAAALPPNDPHHPYIAAAPIAANLAVRAPDRVLTDPALLMVSACPDGVGVLGPALHGHAGLELWLAECGLVAEAEAEPLVNEFTLQRFSRH